MKARQFKDAINEQLARIGKSLGSGPRLELLDLLCQGPRTVEELARQAGQTTGNTSHHLQVLRQARLIKAEKTGVFVTYCLADESVCDFYRALRTLAETHLLEIELVTREFLEARESMEAIDRTALAKRISKGAVTLIDVRPPEEFAAGHIAGAISLPLAELENRLAELPRDREVVAYCRGPYCVLAIEAVTRLKEQGFTALRLSDGVPDWRANGLPVEYEARGV